MEKNYCIKHSLDALDNLQCDVLTINQELKGLQDLLEVFFYKCAANPADDPEETLKKCSNVIYFAMQSIDNIYQKFDLAHDESEIIMFGKKAKGPTINGTYCEE